MKYRLNIPKMINKDFAYLAWCLDGEEEINNLWNNRDYMFKDIPKSWIEEIEEEKICTTPLEYFNYYCPSEGDPTLDETIDIWQASQENRDLLYQDLIKKIQHIIDTKPVTYAALEISRLNDELEKIKEQLKRG